MRDRFYKTDKQLVDDCVGGLLRTSDSALAQARGAAFGFDGMATGEATENARLAWSAMQRARLFCFGPERWKSLYDAADRYVTETLAGVTRDGWSRIRLSSGDVLGDETFIKVIGLAKERDPAFEMKEQRRFVSSPVARTDYHAMLDVYELATKNDHEEMAAMAAAQIFDAYFQPSPGDYEKIISAHEDYGVRWPFPEKLPFDSCFLSFGSMLNLSYSPDALHARVRAAELGKLGARQVSLLGYLVAWEGDKSFVFTALEFEPMIPLSTEENRLTETTVGLLKTYEDGEWQQPMGLDPWVVTMLVSAINEHKQIVTSHGSSLSSRTAKKAASKRADHELPLPAPFYVVDLKDEFIAAPAKPKKTSSGRPVEWSHRFDVRGHECVRIERGQMPTVPKEIEKLKKRGYRVYEGMSLTADDAARLLKRGVRAPGPQEWIAVLSYWRESFVKGPEGKPYVPAARVEAL